MLRPALAARSPDPRRDRARGRRARRRRRRHLHVAAQLSHLANRRLRSTRRTPAAESALRGPGRRTPAGAETTVASAQDGRTSVGSTARSPASSSSCAAERDDRRDRSRAAVPRHDAGRATASARDDRVPRRAAAPIASRYFTVAATKGGERYRVRASIEPDATGTSLDRRHVAERRRQHASPARPGRAARHARRCSRRSPCSGSG